MNPEDGWCIVGPNGRVLEDGFATENAASERIAMLAGEYFESLAYGDPVEDLGMAVDQRCRYTKDGKPRAADVSNGLACMAAHMDAENLSNYSPSEQADIAAAIAWIHKRRIKR